MAIVFFALCWIKYPGLNVIRYAILLSCQAVQMFGAKRSSAVPGE
jgi:hypothetical protein